MNRTISYSDGVPAMLAPLIVVVLTSMIKDAYEDYNRHRKDKEENETACTIMVDGTEVRK